MTTRSKDKKNHYPKKVRFYYAKPDGSEYLVQCQVECEPPVDSEINWTSAPHLYTVDIERAENEDGAEVSADHFLHCWGDLEYFAVQAAEYDNPIPRFFANELQQAEAYAKEMLRQLNDAEFYFEEAEIRYKDARRRQADAAKEVARIREIQKMPV